ncbi:hypothetical protein JQ615_22130 [Bradyrhizobium jicamae]|uniref:Uncharacterized protein n=1 Tax=Bradyrhizobium jicamae TaxID=280332 RepID=A0ABS5FMR8_9BRAD|nr:hypothetical protein [Bradyrhizobium jicamae]MBR0798094.1 hypothetical protein [Bradyrhizobium jicamae]MBR0934482.1 hypothetical protein [Bradyrhizobium jicamae]
MDPEQDIDERTASALRRSYGRLAWWIVRLNRFLEPARLAEPPRPHLPPRIAMLPRRPTPPRPD